MKKNLLLALLGLLLVACSGSGGDDILDNNGGNGGEDDASIIKREQVLGNWMEDQRYNPSTGEWKELTSVYIHCFDEDGTYRRLLKSGLLFEQGTWTLTGNKITVQSDESDPYSFEILLLANEGSPIHYPVMEYNFCESWTNDPDRFRAVQIRENKSFTVGDVTFTMVAVEGGTFQMGAPDDDTDANFTVKPQHPVTLYHFYIGETEVTQALWTAVMGSNPSHYVGDNQPVDQVSWDDCQEFITKLNEMTGQIFRLPTEAEWEYAARGGQQSKGYLYAGSNVLYEVAWCDEVMYLGSSHPVGTKKPNELGIYDMLGNVNEWCYDWYWQNWYEKSIHYSNINPTGPPFAEYEDNEMRVIRGGAWCTVLEGLHTYRRGMRNPSMRYDTQGFRLVLGSE